MKTVYGVSDAENRTGILDDEVKNIDAVLPPLVSWKTVLQDQKKKELVDTFRAQVKEHIVEIEGHYFHTDLYLARCVSSGCCLISSFSLSDSWMRAIGR